MEKKTVRKEPPQALLLVEVVNHFEFPDGDKILKNALPLGARLAQLKERARRGEFHSIESATRASARAETKVRSTQFSMIRVPEGA